MLKIFSEQFSFILWSFRSDCHFWAITVLGCIWSKSKLASNASVNSSCAQPPWATAGYLLTLSVPEWGICKFCTSRAPGICQPLAFDTHAVSYQNITTQGILLQKQADSLICQGWEKIEEVCKGMVSILCMHFFTAYQARITKRNSGAIDVNRRFLGYWIKFLMILLEEHPFIFIKLSIAVNFTLHY